MSKKFIFYVLLITVLSACNSLKEGRNESTISKENVEIDSSAFYLPNLEIQNDQLRGFLDTLSLFNNNDSSRYYDFALPLVNILTISCNNEIDSLSLLKISNDYFIGAYYPISDYFGVYENKGKLIRVIMLGNEADFDTYFNIKEDEKRVETYVVKVDGVVFELGSYNINWKIKTDQHRSDFMVYKRHVDTVQIVLR